MTPKTALITGASKGIGKEFAILFAENQYNIVLIARSSDELSELKSDLEKKHNILAYTIVKDLSLPSSPQKIFDELKGQQINIDFLINNAGFGDYGAFINTEWHRYEQMISLNITALTHLTYLFAKDWMQEKRSGKILNVSSMAAFQPGPMMAVYFATKSFVLSLSEATNNEFRPHNITVTALCPGPTSTNFGTESKMSASELVNNVKIASARNVALVGYRAMMKGKPVVIEGAINKLIPVLVRLLPRQLITKISARVMNKSK